MTQEEFDNFVKEGLIEPFVDKTGHRGFIYKESTGFDPLNIPNELVINYVLKDIKLED